jgi:hypothetical protein
VAQAVADAEDMPLARMVELIRPLPAAYRGDVETAVRAAEELQAAARRRRDDVLMGWTTYVLGEVLLDVEPERAMSLFRDARDEALRLGDRYLAGVSLVAAAALHSRHGDPATAVPLFRDVVEHWRDVGDWVHQWTTLRNVVDLLVRLGRNEEAAVLHGALTARADVAPVFGGDAERMGRGAPRTRESTGSRDIDHLHLARHVALRRRDRGRGAGRARPEPSRAR